MKWMLTADIFPFVDRKNTYNSSYWHHQTERTIPGALLMVPKLQFYDLFYQRVVIFSGSLVFKWFKVITMLIH